jgi:peptidoglycan hydrolase-like protein with peptidoglycan-binding domain
MNRALPGAPIEKEPAMLSPVSTARTPVTAFSNAQGPQYPARGTGYYPANTRLEGGFLDRKGKPLNTLQDYLAGKAPYVSVAMDAKAFPYGTRLRIPELEKKYGRPIEFRVVDTGGAFRNKGTRRIDICTANEKASLDPTINGKLTLVPVTGAAQPGSNPAGGAGQAQGASKDPVSRVQRELNSLGYGVGSADGIVGPRTSQGLERFQRAHGLPVTGKLDTPTAQALSRAMKWPDRWTAAPATKQVEQGGQLLKLGSSGESVKELQKLLGVQQTGQFGTTTRERLLEAQRELGLKTPAGLEGAAGKTTLETLRNRAARPTTPRPGGDEHAGHDHPVGNTTGTGTRSVSGIHAGRGWGGSEGVADAAKAISRQMGVPVTSQKRDLAATRRVGSTTRSDHYTGNTSAYAVDFGVKGKRGDALAQAIAKRYGIPASNIGTYNRHIIEVDGKKYSLQLLWKVKGHYDHVHLGIHRV